MEEVQCISMTHICFHKEIQSNIALIMSSARLNVFKTHFVGSSTKTLMRLTYGIAKKRKLTDNPYSSVKWKMIV